MVGGHRKIFKYLKKKYKEHKAQSAGAQSASQEQPQSFQQQQQPPPPQSHEQQHPGGGAWAAGPPPQQEQGAASGYYQSGHDAYQQQPQQQHQPPPSHGWSTSTDAGLDGDATEIRNQAIREGDLMSQCFDDAHKAYESGDGARAKELSEQGHHHQSRMNELNEQASELIFRQKNSSQPAGTVDLHGLYVQEAIEKAERAVKDAQSQNLEELRLIVGKGIHSKSHVAKIKPAIQDLMEKHNLSAQLDPHNAGVVIVDLTGRSGRDSGFVHDMARDASGDSEQCIIS